MKVAVRVLVSIEFLSCREYPGGVSVRQQRTDRCGAGSTASARLDRRVAPIRAERASREVPWERPDAHRGGEDAEVGEHERERGGRRSPVAIAHQRVEEAER